MSGRLRVAGNFRLVFANRMLRLLELAWAGSTLATYSYAVGVAVYAYKQGGANEVAVVGFGRWGAAAALTPWVAFLAERLRRRRLMISSSTVRALVLAGAAGCIALHGPPLILYVATGVVAVAASAFHPAEAALRPVLARTPDELVGANVLSSTIASAGVVIGPGLGGLVIAVTGTSTLFALASLFFLASAVAALRIDAVEERPRAPDGSLRGVLAAPIVGFREVVRDRRLRLLFELSTAALVVNGVLTVLLVVLALRLLGLGQGGVGWVDAALGFGGVAAGFVAARLVQRDRIAIALALSAVVSGTAIAATAAWTNTPFVIAALVAAGAGGTLTTIAELTLLQRIASDAQIARIFGVLETTILATLGLGSLLAAGAIHVFGPRGALVAAGLVVPAVIAIRWPRIKSLAASAADFGDELVLLRRIPLFAALPSARLERLAGALSTRVFEPGMTVISSGDEGDRFYVIDEGHACVSVDGDARVKIGPGDFFGEIALLRNVRRTATVRAVEPLRVYTLDRETFLAAVTELPASIEAAERVVAARLAEAV